MVITEITDDEFYLAEQTNHRAKNPLFEVYFSKAVIVKMDDFSYEFITEINFDIFPETYLKMCYNKKYE